MKGLFFMTSFNPTNYETARMRATIKSFSQIGKWQLPCLQRNLKPNLLLE
jgi:hypothetical protein